MQRPSQRFRSVQFFIFEIFGRNDSPSYRTLYGDAGRFSFIVKISGISRSAVNGTRLVGSSHSKIPRKSGKS